jgi:iron(III) transport system ATP-binding protein
MPADHPRVAQQASAELAAESPGELHAPSPSASTGSQPAVRLRDVRKTFRRRGGELVHAVDGVSLDVEQGEFVVLLGPSGCGKTTLLRSVAGLERPDSGDIEVVGQSVFSSTQHASRRS